MAAITQQEAILRQQFNSIPSTYKINHLADGSANSDNEGKIKFYWNNHCEEKIQSYMCLQKYGMFEWEPIDLVSSANWMKNRMNANECMIEMMTKICGKRHLEAKQEKKEKNKLIKSLITTLSKQQRIDWIKANPEYEKMVCQQCGILNPKKKKCIHHDCCGMCENCFKIEQKDNKQVCNACNRSQELSCPICMEEYKIDFMVKSDTCSHHVCWKCFGSSIKTSRPLADCPLCRAIFCKHLKEAAYDSSSDDEMPMLEDDYLSDDGIAFEDFSDEDLVVELDNEQIAALLANPNITTRV